MKTLKQLSSWAAKKLSTLVIADLFRNSIAVIISRLCDCVSLHAMTGKVNNHSTVQPFNHSTARQVAFTLAEVLITLAIIGIVAALTIPTLISKFEQKVLITSFKKIYANMTVALQATVLEDNYGNAYPCYAISNYENESSCNQFYKDFTKHLKLIKTETIIYLPYKNRSEVEAEGGTLVRDITNMSTTTSDDLFSNNGKGYYKYYFADGSTFYRSSYYHSIHPALIIVDVNGDKAPNRWGYDVYVLMLGKQNNGAMYITRSYRYMIEKGGMSAEEIIKNNF